MLANALPLSPRHAMLSHMLFHMLYMLSNMLSLWPAHVHLFQLQLESLDLNSRVGRGVTGVLQTARTASRISRARRIRKYSINIASIH
jgi:hypothetical protein